jgi:hypothetical protein
VMVANGSRPGFVIVGAPKCGTTALYTWLDQPPGVYMSKPKEPDWFGRDIERGAPHDEVARADPVAPPRSSWNGLCEDDAVVNSPAAPTGTPSPFSPPHRRGGEPATELTPTTLKHHERTLLIISRWQLV